MYFQKPKSKLYKNISSDILQKIQEALDNQPSADEESEETELSFIPFIKPENQELTNRGIIFINSTITKDNLAQASQKLLTLHFDKEFNDEVQIILNSPGGYLDACWAFIDLMQTSRLKIKTLAVGEIASAATMIFIAGDERIMSPHSTAMIHNFSGGNFGTYNELVASRKIEDYQSKLIINHFIKNSKYKTIKDINTYILLDRDNWLSPKEMKYHGLCDKVLSVNNRRRKKK